MVFSSDLSTIAVSKTKRRTVEQARRKSLPRKLPRAVATRNRRGRITDMRISDGGGESGLYLGRFLDEEAGRLGDKLVYSGERHALVFGPNGSGKGARFLMVNL